MFGKIGVALCLILNLAAGLSSAPTWAAEVSESPKVDEIIVRYKDGTVGATQARLSGTQRAMETSARVGESLAHVRSTKDGDHVMRAGRKMTRAQAWELATRIVQQGEAEFAQPIDPEFDLRPPAKPPVKINVGAKP